MEKICSDRKQPPRWLALFHCLCVDLPFPTRSNLNWIHESMEGIIYTENRRRAGRTIGLSMFLSSEVSWTVFVGFTLPSYMLHLPAYKRCRIVSHGYWSLGRLFPSFFGEAFNVQRSSGSSDTAGNIVTPSINRTNALPMYN